MAMTGGFAHSLATSCANTRDSDRAKWALSAAASRQRSKNRTRSGSSQSICAECSTQPSSPRDRCTCSRLIFTRRSKLSLRPSTDPTTIIIKLPSHSPRRVGAAARTLVVSVVMLAFRFPGGGQFVCYRLVRPPGPALRPHAREFFCANCRDCDKVAYELRLSVAGSGTPSDRERGSVGRNRIFRQRIRLDQ